VRKWLFFCSLAFILLLAGCSDNSGKQSSQNKQKVEGPSHQALDLLPEKAKQIDIEVPDFLTDKPSTVPQLYKLAYANQDVLKYMPCFCGCVNTGHKSNQDCYIKDARKNGAVVWDKMAAT
jgi:hypothetical protein